MPDTKRTEASGVAPPSSPANEAVAAACIAKFSDVAATMTATAGAEWGLQRGERQSFFLNLQRDRRPKRASCVAKGASFALAASASGGSLHRVKAAGITGPRNRLE